MLIHWHLGQPGEVVLVAASSYTAGMLGMVCRATEPTLCCLNGFHIKVLLKERVTEATVHKRLVALPTALFGLWLVLTSPCSLLWLLVWCSRLAAAALLGLPFSPGAYPGSGMKQVGLGLKPVSKSCQITGKALQGVQAFTTMAPKDVFPSCLQRAGILGVQALAMSSYNWKCKMNL